MALGIRAKITGAMLVGALVPLLAFGVMDYLEFRQEAIATERRHLSTVAERQSVHIADILDSTRRGLRTISSQPVLSDLNAETSRQLTKIFVKSYDWVRNAYIADTTGQQFVRDDETVRLVDISERDYFKNALQGKITTQVSISKSIGKPVLLSGAPIYSKKNPEEVVGVCDGVRRVPRAHQLLRGDRPRRAPVQPPAAPVVRRAGAAGAVALEVHGPTLAR